LIEEFTKNAWKVSISWLDCSVYFNSVSHFVSIQPRASERIAFTRVDHTRELHYASRGFDAHNEPMSGGQNELINPPETARIMHRSIITRAFTISCISWIWKSKIAYLDWKSNLDYLWVFISIKKKQKIYFIVKNILTYTLKNIN